jgi:hypothetical protein
MDGADCNARMRLVRDEAITLSGHASCRNAGVTFFGENTMSVDPANRDPSETAERIPESPPYRFDPPRRGGGEGMSTARFPRPAEVRNSDGPSAGSAPPVEAQTDPHRGTGELGMEGLDSSQPLTRND